MAVSWPRMAAAPPPGYVAFVGRHLKSLRQRAARAVGDEHADELYPDVLADVAGAWGRLSLLGRLGRPAAAEEYLRRAFARRARRWPPDEPPELDIEVWRTWEPAGAGIQLRRPPARRAVPSNAATRLAPYLRPEHPPEVGPDIEAAVAWWHAYEDRRRRWLFVGLAALLVVAALLVRMQRDLALGG